MDATLLLCGALLCNDARLEERNDEKNDEKNRIAGKGWQIIGDPTEGAMVVAAAKSGFRRDDLGSRFPGFRRFLLIPSESA